MCTLSKFTQLLVSLYLLIRKYETSKNKPYLIDESDTRWERRVALIKFLLWKGRDVPIRIINPNPTKVSKLLKRGIFIPQNHSTLNTEGVVFYPNHNKLVVLIQTHVKEKGILRHYICHAIPFFFKWWVNFIIGWFFNSGWLQSIYRL